MLGLCKELKEEWESVLDKVVLYVGDGGRVSFWKD